MTAQETASKKDKFDLCLKLLEAYYGALDSRIEKTVALLLVLVGWLATSDTARKSIQNDAALFAGAIITLTLLIIFLTFNMRRFLGKFIKIRSQAVGLKYMEPEYFIRYPELTRWHLLVYLAPVLIFYIFILLLLFQIRCNFLSLAS